MPAFSIVGDLLLRTGSFTTDADRARKSIKKFEQDAIAAVGGAAKVLTGLGAAAAGAFLALERGAAAIGKFKDLGDVIGDTGEAVASLQVAADVSGTSLDTVTSASVKLTAALSKTDDESKGAGAALAALNIPIEEFKRLSPVAQIDAVSKALAGFKDGAEKTAIAVALFGKSGAQLIPFLKELSDQGGPKVIITQDQIEAADKFADSTAKLKSQVTQLGQSVLADLLPPFQAFVEEIGEADRALSIFAVAGSAVRIFFETITVLGANVIFVFKGIGNEIGGIAAQLAVLARGDLKGFSAISDAMKADAAKARAELDKFEQRILGATSNDALTKQARRVEDRGFDPRTQINTSGLVTDSDKDDSRKKLLENQLKALENVVKREQSLLGDRNRFLDLFNGQGLISIQSYYDAQLAIIEAATNSQVAAYDKQLAALRAFQKQQAKPSERADTQGKIDDVIEKRSKIEKESSLKVIELSVKKTEEERKFAQQIDSTRASVFALEGSLSKAAEIRFDQQNFELVRRLTTEGNTEGLKLVGTLRQAAIEQAKFTEAEPVRQLNAQVLELQGNLGAAAAIRFDSANFEAVQRFTVQGNTEALKLVATLRAATIAQADFNKEATDAQRIFDQLTNNEDRIGIGRQLGATTELGALKQLGEARQAAVRQLEAMVQAQEAIAKASGNPALIQNAERARIELERLRATADPLADKFRGIFETSFGDAFGDFITGAKSAKDAFLDFANSVADQIARLAAQNIAQSLFGQGGALGGVGSAFGGLFGGGETADGASGTSKAGADTAAATATTALAGSATLASGSLAAIPTVTPTTISSLVGLQFAADAAAAALAQIATEKAAAGTGEFIFGAIAAFAEGGSPPVGKVSMGGERGAEIFLRNSDAGQVLRRVMYGKGIQQVNGPTLIGQSGPQFFRPSVPGVVIPAEETERFLKLWDGDSFAGGGFPSMGRTSIGGEQGQELFIPITNGMKPPTDDEEKTSRAQVLQVTNNFTLQGPVDRRTESQIATKAGQGVQRVMSRGNA